MPNPSSLLVCIALLLAASIARADGMMAPRIREVGQATDLVVSSPKQEALLAVTQPDQVTVLLRTHFQRGPDEVGWLIPVPAPPSSVEPGSEAVFASLEKATAPRFLTFEPSPGWQPVFGCSAAAVRERAVLNSVSVQSTGVAGIFQFTVLKAQRVEDLTDWLRDHHYAVPPGAAEVLPRYVRAGWSFLALRLRPEAGDAATVAPHPIRYTYRSSRLTFPLVISRPSAAPENEVLLYVLAQRRYESANFRNLALNRDFVVDVDARPPSGTNYERLLRQQARQDPLTLVTEFAGLTVGDEFKDIRGELAGLGATAADARWYLTRLRGVFTPEAMVADIGLVPSHETRDVYPIVTISRRQAAGMVPGTLLAAAAAGLAFSRRRRGGRWMRVGLVAVAGAALVML